MDYALFTEKVLQKAKDPVHEMYGNNADKVMGEIKDFLTKNQKVFTNAIAKAQNGEPVKDTFAALHNEVQMRTKNYSIQAKSTANIGNEICKIVCSVIKSLVSIDLCKLCDELK